MGYLCINGVCTPLSDLSPREQAGLLKLDADGDGNVVYSYDKTIGETSSFTYYDSRSGFQTLRLKTDVTNLGIFPSGALFNRLMDYRELSLKNGDKFGLYVVFQGDVWRDRHTRSMVPVLEKSFVALRFVGLLPRDIDRATVIIRDEKYTCHDFESCEGDNGKGRIIGFVSSQENTIVLQDLQRDEFDSFDNTFVHEAAHLYLRKAANGRHLPRWVDEGIASYTNKLMFMSRRYDFDLDDDEEFRWYLDQKTNVGFEKDPILFFKRLEEVTNEYDVTTVGTLFFMFIAFQYSPEAVGRFIKNLSNMSVENALAKATGERSYSDLLAKYYDFIAKKLLENTEHEDERFRSDYFKIDLIKVGTGGKTCILKQHRWDPPLTEDEKRVLLRVLERQEDDIFGKSPMVYVDVDFAKEDRRKIDMTQNYYPSLRLHPSMLDDEDKLYEAIR